MEQDVSMTQDRPPKVVIVRSCEGCPSFTENRGRYAFKSPFACDYGHIVQGYAMPLWERDKIDSDCPLPDLGERERRIEGWIIDHFAGAGDHSSYELLSSILNEVRTEV